MDVEELKTGLIAATCEFWAANQKPLLLSNLPPLLAKRGLGDYKTVLNGDSLKTFAGRLAGQATFSIVTHPKHKAKVGLIPSDQTYTFAIEHSSPQTVEITGNANGATALLSILSRLSPEDLEKVVIPVSVLVKLQSMP